MNKHYLEKDFFSPEELISVRFAHTRSFVSMHSHEFWEFVYLYEGEGLHITPTVRETMNTGDFLLIRPGSSHAIVSDLETSTPGRICNCLIKCSFMEELIHEFELQTKSELAGYKLYELLTTKQPICIRGTDDNARNIRHLIWLAAHEYNHFTDASAMMIRYSLVCLLTCMTRLYEYQSGRLATPVSKRGDIDELIKYMTYNFAQPLTLEILAQHTHLSREYLSRAFKKQTGKNLFDYLTEIRITRAKDMLRTNTFSIEYIGEYCGYQTCDAFRKAFRRVTGMSPGEYRKRSILSS